MDKLNFKNEKASNMLEEKNFSGICSFGKFCHFFYYFICAVFIERSAAPQTALWRGPGPRFEPGMGGTSAAGRLTH